METMEDHNQTANQSQGNIRLADLQRWMYLNNVTHVDFGRLRGDCRHNK